jgi:hypothetical protein
MNQLDLHERGMNQDLLKNKREDNTPMSDLPF